MYFILLKINFYREPRLYKNKEKIGKANRKEVQKGQVGTQTAIKGN